MSTIQITYKLNVLPSNVVMVPGHEPNSTITSTEVAVQMRKVRPWTVDELDAKWWRAQVQGPARIWADHIVCDPPPPAECPVFINPQADLQALGNMGAAIVPLNDVLKAIPGSKVVFLITSGQTSSRKLLELPPAGVDCPCQTVEDYYKIMRNLANAQAVTPDTIDDILDACGDMFDVGWLRGS